MTLAHNAPMDCEPDHDESFDDLPGFQKLRPNRDGQMPVGRDRARHRGHRRSYAQRTTRSAPMRGGSK